MPLLSHDAREILRLERLVLERARLLLVAAPLSDRKQVCVSHELETAVAEDGCILHLIALKLDDGVARVVSDVLSAILTLQALYYLAQCAFVLLERAVLCLRDVLHHEHDFGTFNDLSLHVMSLVVETSLVLSYLCLKTDDFVDAFQQLVECFLLLREVFRLALQDGLGDALDLLSELHRFDIHRLLLSLRLV